MVKLEPDPFLNELNKLFERNAAKGSVSITMKHSECLQCVALWLTAYHWPFDPLRTCTHVCMWSWQRSLPFREK